MELQHFITRSHSQIIPV